jgi:putative addiction module component
MAVVRSPVSYLLPTISQMMWAVKPQKPEKWTRAAWNDEIKKRITDLNSGNAKTVPWGEVRKEFERGFLFEFRRDPNFCYQQACRKDTVHLN